MIHQISDVSAAVGGGMRVARADVGKLMCDADGGVGAVGWAEGWEGRQQMGRGCVGSDVCGVWVVWAVWMRRCRWYRCVAWACMRAIWYIKKLMYRASRRRYISPRMLTEVCIGTSDI